MGSISAWVNGRTGKDPGTALQQHRRDQRDRNQRPDRRDEDDLRCEPGVGAVLLREDDGVCGGGHRGHRDHDPVDEGVGKDRGEEGAVGRRDGEEEDGARRPDPPVPDHLPGRERREHRPDDDHRKRRRHPAEEADRVDERPRDLHRAEEEGEPDDGCRDPGVREQPRVKPLPPPFGEHRDPDREDQDVEDEVEDGDVEEGVLPEECQGDREPHEPHVPEDDRKLENPFLRGRDPHRSGDGPGKGEREDVEGSGREDQGFGAGETCGGERHLHGGDDQRRDGDVDEEPGETPGGPGVQDLCGDGDVSGGDQEDQDEDLVRNYQEIRDRTVHEDPAPSGSSR